MDIVNQCINVNELFNDTTNTIQVNFSLVSPFTGKVFQNYIALFIIQT
jgi:hypothetical protein